MLKEEKTVIFVSDLKKTESSNVDIIGYSDTLNKAFVKFKNGTLYQYDDVNHEAYADLSNAKSGGSHLSKVFLKKGFEYSKLEDTEIETVKSLTEGIPNQDEDISKVIGGHNE